MNNTDKQHQYLLNSENCGDSKALVLFSTDPNSAKPRFSSAQLDMLPHKKETNMLTISNPGAITSDKPLSVIGEVVMNFFGKYYTVGKSIAGAPQTPIRCLIATATFGSELTSQVQFLREFRDDHIFSTVTGSSFMNVFNSWYYSFSPTVADFERQQPWLQQSVKVIIYPLLSILYLSEQAHSQIGGELGVIVAGVIASSLLGAIYFSPMALISKMVRKGNFNCKLLLVFAICCISLVVSLVIGDQNVMMVTTSIFVLATIGTSSLFFANMVTNTSLKVSRLIRNANPV